MNRALVVSIHDVSPLTRLVTETMLNELAEGGIARTSLLVVPDHHGRGHFLDDPAFCEWLKAKVVAGHEAVIHGYYHRRERRDGESFADRVTTRFYTAGEGEFYDIAEDKAYTAVMKAREEFAQLGLNPPGFIAPAWLLGEAGETALKRASIRYTTRLGNVLDLETGEAHASQSMVYSVRSGWRRVVSLAWNAFLYSRLRKNPLLRIGIHPPDHRYPRIWKQILHYAGEAAKDREPTTYADWVQCRLR